MSTIEATSENKQDEDLWNTIGFHRPLAGLLYNLVIIFIAAGLGILITVWLFPNYILPFPEALGFENITTQFFAIYFVLLDLGIGNSIQRFVAEENVKNPKNAIKYIQFFIWYQLMSGLLQVTVISIVVLVYMPETELAYACWFFLFYGTVQYPGMLGIFRGTLEAYQRFDRANLIDFIQYQLFENVFKIILVLLGRWIGSMNPAFGELVGATIGAIMGKYMKDFASAILAAYWVKPILQEIDPSYGLKNVFLVEFDREIVKKCLWFGARVMVPGLISPLANFIATFIQLRYLPNYSSILGMYAMGEMLGTMVTTFKFTGIGASISESYFNKKYNLTRNYIENAYRWDGIFGFFMVGLLFYGSEMIGVIIGGNFSLVAVILRSFIFFKLISVFTGQNDLFFNGAGKPEYTIYLTLAEQGTRLFVLWLLLVPFPSTWYALVYSIGAGWVVRWFLGLFFLKTKVVNIKINIWQSFIAPLIAAATQSLVIYLSKLYFLPIISGWIGDIAGSIVSMIFMLFITLLFVYFPVYAFLGGWDKYSLDLLNESLDMCGPSKFVVRYLYKISKGISKISPLYNKFSMDIEGVDSEIQELMEVKKENAIKLQNISEVVDAAEVPKN